MERIGILALLTSTLLAAGATACDDGEGHDDEDPCEAVESPCTTAGVGRCVGDTIERCGVDANACLVWQLAEDCGLAGETCSSATGTAECVTGCDHGCDAVGATRCEGTAVQTCGEGEDGCRAWQTTAECSERRQACVESPSGANCTISCVHGCETIGFSRCSEAVVEECEADASGCRAWVAGEDCAASGLPCVEDGNRAACGCGTTCTAGETRCAAAVIETCTEGEDGCTTWSAGTDCGATGLACDDASEPAVCVP
jgi:hypothetical protein